MKPKYKIGDRVSIKKKFWKGPAVGNVCTDGEIINIIQHENCPSHYRVKFDKPIQICQFPYKIESELFRESELELDIKANRQNKLEIILPF